MTSVPGVFAGGDGQHGPRTAVEAIRSGKIAAASIDAWLRGAPIDAAAGQPVRRAEVIPLLVVAHDRTSPAACRDARKARRGGARRGQLRADRGGPDRRDGARRGPPLPALRRLHRLRPVHGGLQRDGRRGAAHGRHAGRPARLLRLRRGRPSCASAAAPARRSARPARSTSRIGTACGARSSPARSCASSRC